MEVEELKGAEAAAQRCAAVLAAEIEAGARDIGLTGGTSPLRVYERLGLMVDDWQGVRLGYGDERCVPFDDPESNHGSARDHLDVPGADWRPMPGELGPDAGATAYAADLGDTVLDVLLLGMGPDAHVASLMPDRSAIDAEGVCVGIQDSPKPPPRRIALTLGQINPAAASSCWSQMRPSASRWLAWSTPTPARTRTCPPPCSRATGCWSSPTPRPWDERRTQALADPPRPDGVVAERTAHGVD